jgi:hypothetical protein
LTPTIAMRITRDDRQNLTVVDFPWGWLCVGVVSLLAVIARIVYEHYTPAAWQQDPWAMLGGGVFIALACSLFSTRVVLSLDLEARTIRWSQVGLTGQRHAKLSFDQFRQTILRQSHGSSHRRPSWRLVVETTEGDFPLSFSFDLGDEARQRCFDVARRIEASIAATSRSRRHEEVPA